MKRFISGLWFYIAAHAFVLGGVFYIWLAATDGLWLFWLVGAVHLVLGLLFMWGIVEALADFRDKYRERPE